MKDEDIKGLPITWVNTPLSYAKLTTKYNLFQQSVLLKVSESLQRQMELYYGSDMKNNPDVPRPLFSEEQKIMGLGKIYVSYAELGVAASSFPKVREEAQKCLRDMVVGGPIIMKNGQPTQSFFPVFTEVHVDHSNSMCSFELNTAFIDEVKKVRVIDYTFDMSQRYVKHPDNIAIVGKVEKMPGLYFLLRDRMQSWKYKKARLTVTHIKEFLNLYKVDKETGTKEPRYPKFSQFRNHVLEPALADIQRLKDMGQIDVSFTMDIIYKGKRKVGDPECIIFSIINDKAKASRVGEQTVIDFPEPELKEVVGQKEWNQFLQAYKGIYAYMLEGLKFAGFANDTLTLQARQAFVESFKGLIKQGSEQDRAELNNALYECFGRNVKLNYQFVL